MTNQEHTDRELLELAAKAAGYAHWDFLAFDDCQRLNVYFDDGSHDMWNSLEDDGDAFRLAVRLRFDINHMAMEVFAIEQVRSIVVVEPNDDPYAATRRAITRAAAQIGKEMP